jgi:glycine cleavage system H protein
MGQDRQREIRYKRSRFSTRLPVDRRYTASHFWTFEEGSGLWRVGMTKFATRMLGDLVEFEFDAKPGQQVSVGQTIGWIEAFKALTDLYCVVDGVFRGVNPLIEGDISLVDSDPYGKGWLYSVSGSPESKSVDVHGYVEILDLAIDKMKEQAGDRDSHG